MKKSIRITVLGICLVALSFGVTSFEKKEFTVVIDAGHGGQDHGAQAADISEKALTAKITQKIQETMKNESVTVHFTRLDDQMKSLSDRVNYVNQLQPDLLISLHVNQSKNENAQGFELYYSEDSKTAAASLSQAEQLASTLATRTSLNNRGVKKGPFYILKNANCPAVLLEMGFVTNAHDQAYLTSQSGQNALAQSIIEHLQNQK